MKRTFDDVILNLKDSVATYEYFVDFKKVLNNIKNIEIELNLLNYLIGKENIKEEFKLLITKYPNTITVIPILLAIRSKEIKITEEKEIVYNFKNKNVDLEKVSVLMEKSGLFTLLKDKKIKNIVDYVLGIEVGLDSNARKNRTGKIMEDIVEKYISQVSNIEYIRQATTDKIKETWNIDLSGQLVFDIEKSKNNKRFDFAIRTKKNKIFLIETNFYNVGGSKLNETARSYLKLANYLENNENIEFIWITDGKGWLSTKNNLKEAYQEIDKLYTIVDLEKGVLKEIENI